MQPAEQIKSVAPVSFLTDFSACYFTASVKPRTMQGIVNIDQVYTDATDLLCNFPATSLDRFVNPKPKDRLCKGNLAVLLTAADVAFSRDPKAEIITKLRTSGHSPATVVEMCGTKLLESLPHQDAVYNIFKRIADHTDEVPALFAKDQVVSAAWTLASLEMTRLLQYCSVTCAPMSSVYTLQNLPGKGITFQPGFKATDMLTKRLGALRAALKTISDANAERITSFYMLAAAQLGWNAGINAFVTSLCGESAEAGGLYAMALDAYLSSVDAEKEVIDWQGYQCRSTSFYDYNFYELLALLSTGTYLVRISSVTKSAAAQGLLCVSLAERKFLALPAVFLHWATKIMEAEGMLTIVVADEQNTGQLVFAATGGRAVMPISQVFTRGWYRPVTASGVAADEARVAAPGPYIVGAATALAIMMHGVIHNNARAKPVFQAHFASHAKKRHERYLQWFVRHSHNSRPTVQTLLNASASEVASCRRKLANNLDRLFNTRVDNTVDPRLIGAAPLFVDAEAQPCGDTSGIPRSMQRIAHGNDGQTFAEFRAENRDMVPQAMDYVPKPLPLLREEQMLADEMTRLMPSDQPDLAVVGSKFTPLEPATASMMGPTGLAPEAITDVISVADQDAQLDTKGLCALFAREYEEYIMQARRMDPSMGEMRQSVQTPWIALPEDEMVERARIICSDVIQTFSHHSRDSFWVTQPVPVAEACAKMMEIAKADVHWHAFLPVAFENKSGNILSFYCKPGKKEGVTDLYVFCPTPQIARMMKMKYSQAVDPKEFNMFWRSLNDVFPSGVDMPAENDPLLHVLIAVHVLALISGYIPLRSVLEIEHRTISHAVMASMDLIWGGKEALGHVAFFKAVKNWVDADSAITTYTEMSADNTIAAERVDLLRVSPASCWSKAS